MKLETVDSVDQSAQTSAGSLAMKRWNFGMALRIEWLGQTLASLCWVVSVFVYGISSPGDILQLAAASFWFIANIAALYCVVDRS